MTPDSQSQHSLQDSLPGAGDPVPGPARPGRAVVWRVWGTVLSLALLFYVIRAQSWDEFTQVLSQLPGYYVWTALGLTLCSRVFVGLRWFTLLRSAGVKISFWRSQI